MDKDTLNALDKFIIEIREDILPKFKKEIKDDIMLEVNQRLDKMDQKIDNFREEILNRQFLFESEYGTKINAIFDAVTLELDKNLEKSEKIRKLEKRVERNEVTIFDHEKRISKLELNVL